MPINTQQSPYCKQLVSLRANDDVLVDDLPHKHLDNDLEEEEDLAQLIQHFIDEEEEEEDLNQPRRLFL